MSTFRYLVSVIFSLPFFFVALFLGVCIHGLINAADRLPSELYWVSMVCFGIFTALVGSLLVAGVFANNGSKKARAYLQTFSSRN
jgi:hypothetical protein